MIFCHQHLIHDYTFIEGCKRFLQTDQRLFVLHACNRNLFVDHSSKLKFYFGEYFFQILLQFMKRFSLIEIRKICYAVIEYTNYRDMYSCTVANQKDINENKVYSWSIDPKIIGGIIVEHNFVMYDGSYSCKLQKIAKRLADKLWDDQLCQDQQENDELQEESDD